jgi:hypothetical protein
MENENYYKLKMNRKLKLKINRNYSMCAKKQLMDHEN